MLSAEKLKKRFYIFLVFYVLFGIALLLILDRAVSPDFEQKYKTILSVFKFLYIVLPSVLSLILTNYIDKKLVELKSMLGHSTNGEIRSKLFEIINCYNG